MIERWHVHIIVLDLDDTLYPERDFVMSGFAAVGEWLKTSHGVNDFEAEARKLFAAGRRGKVFDEALEHIGVPSSSSLVAKMVNVYRAHRPTLRLFPDADDLLYWALRTGLQLGLLTDGIASVQRNKVTSLGLDVRIGCCIVTDEIGGKDFWKPHPEGFLRVMAQHPGPAESFVYVADNPQKDFIAPRKLGWRTLRVRRAGGEHADYEAREGENAERDVSTLAELPALLVGPS